MFSCSRMRILYFFKSKIPQIVKYIHLHFVWASLVAQRLKRLPPMRETRVRSLGREDPLEKEMAIHSSILAWRIPWTEKPSRLRRSLVGYSPRGHKESDMTERLHLGYLQTFVFPYKLKNKFIDIHKMTYWDFYLNCIEFALNHWTDNIQISYPLTWNICPFICFFFDLFIYLYQGFVIFLI